MFIGLSASMIALRRSAMWVLSTTHLNSHATLVKPRTNSFLAPHSTPTECTYYYIWFYKHRTPTEWRLLREPRVLNLRTFDKS